MGRLRATRVLAAGLAILVLLWCLATAGLYAAMRQTPEAFGAIMSHVPGPAMIVLPFKPLWNSARAGHLRIGDTERAYTGWPDRLYVIGTDGRVRFKSAPGPFGFSTSDLEHVLIQTLH